MSQFPINKYSCSQSALYSASDTIADNLEDNLADFTAFKGKYLAAFVTALRAGIDAARQLPDAQSRGAAAETARVQLIALNEQCLLNFQSLKRYIEAVFPKGEWKAREEDAGGDYYEKAGQKNWENTVSMNTSANSFIASNTVTLSDGGNNMPAAFPAAYTADALAFYTLYNDFKTFSETLAATEEKIIANNAVYDAVMEVCKDGSIIYSNDAGMASLFTWSVVLDIVAPPGTASLKFSVVLDESDAPAEGANVKLKKQGTNVEQNMLTDANGEALFEPLEPATYVWGVTLEGRHPEVGLKEITTGVASHVEVRLLEPA